MPQILYEDNHQLIVNKPAGLLTQPSGTNQPNLEDQCKVYLKEAYAKTGNVFLEAVHRIDKPVSGIVVFAKTSKGLSRLNQSMREKKATKKYLALVSGRLPQQEGWLEHYLIHGDHQAFVSTKNHSDAKLARLHYTVLQEENGTSLLEIVLDTGRYHQIRAQLAAEHCPIAGDTRYGSQVVVSFPGIALHHHKLSIPHPTTGDMQAFEATDKPW